jgi:hypothetical protein
MWAHIVNGAVVEITSDDPRGRFYSSIVWVACDATVRPGWVYEAGAFHAPTAPEAQAVYVPVPVARARLEAAGKWAALVTALSSDMPSLIKLMTLQYGLDPNDQQVRSILTAIGADPAVILAV